MDSSIWYNFKKKPTSALKKQIIMNYTNLVHYVIRRSKFKSVNIIDEKDYFQFGIEGLSEAIDRFDPDYGTKFETYAIQRIKGKIIDEIRKVQIKPRYGTNNDNEVYYSNVSLNNSFDDDNGYMLYETLPIQADQYFARQAGLKIYVCFPPYQSDWGVFPILLRLHLPAELPDYWVLDHP